MHHEFQKFTITARPVRSLLLSFEPSSVRTENAGTVLPKSWLVLESAFGSLPTCVASTTDRPTTITAAASAIHRAGCLIPAPLPRTGRPRAAARRRGSLGAARDRDV